MKMETAKNNEVYLRTPSQEVLAVKVLQCRKILDKEYQHLSSIWKNQVVTTKDASVFLNYVLSLIRFRARFTNGKQKSFKRCFFCKSREAVQRYADASNLDNKVWVCETCALNLPDKVVPVRVQENE